MKVPTATCYYADWDDDGRGQGLIVLEDLIARGGTFGHSTQHPGIDGVATARSEEHTSELQSLMRISYADLCLKKKKPNTNTHHLENSTLRQHKINTRSQ